MLKYDRRDAVTNALVSPLQRLPAEMGEMYNLSAENTHRTGNTDAVRWGLSEEYKPILDEIEKRTGQRLINPGNYLGMNDSGDNGQAMYQYGLSRLNDFIQRNKADLPDIAPLTHDEVMERVIKKGLATREDLAVATQYSGLPEQGAGFVGSVAAGITDPVNLASMLMGLGGSTKLLPMMAREAGINMATEAITEGQKQETAKTFGLPDRTLGDFIGDVTVAGLIGAGLPAVGKGVSAGVKSAAPKVTEAVALMRNLRSSQIPQARSQGIVGERALESVTQDNPSAYASRVAAAESGGNLAAKASTSSATGKFQFIESTWNEIAQETGVPPVVKGQPDPRLNEEFQNLQFEAFTKRNGAALRDAGLPVDDTNLYLSHFLGAQGAVDFLQGVQASPDAPATAFVSAEAAAANRNVFYKANGQPRSAQETYNWAAKKMNTDAAVGLPETHIANYDRTMQTMAEDGPIPEPAVIPGKMRPPHVDGIELVNPDSIQVDARTFQFKEGGDALGVTDRLKGVSKWEQDFAGVSLVYEKADGTRFIADGHQRLSLARRAQGEGQEAFLTARVLKEADGWTPEMVRSRAALKNIAEGTGSPMDAAKIFRAMRAADLPPLPPTSALVRQGRALAELGDEPFQMVVNGVVPENYGAIVGRLMRDPKMQEAAIRVLNQVKPENTVQAETIVRQVGQTEVTPTSQIDMFGEKAITESLYGERAKLMDAALKSLKKDKAVFSTLVDQADRIEGAGNRLSRETNLERMTEDAKVADLIQKLASRKGPISDALTDAAKALKEGARAGDATRSFLKAVRGTADGSIDGGSGGRSSGSVADGQRALEPAEIKAQQEYLEKQGPDFFDQQISDRVDEAITGGVISRDTEMYVEGPGGVMIKRKMGDVLDELKADETLVTELTACVEGAAEAAA